MPVYAGVDGEVIACWRNSPYSDAWPKQRQLIGGNFLMIQTAADKYVYYAHLDTGSIPSGLCPNDDEWLTHDPTDPTLYDDSRVPCLLKPQAQCMNAEAYVPSGSRPVVEAGEFIGRIGAHGNASGAHLHVHVGNVTTDTDGYPNTFDQFHHIVFDRTWYQPAGSATDTTAWTYIEWDDPDTLLNALDTADQLIWADAKPLKSLAAGDHLGDYDGDSEEDMLCHATTIGTLWIDYEELHVFDGTDWSHYGGWCKGPTQRLHTAKINDDFVYDLLCHDVESGQIWIDYGIYYADAFLGTEFTTAGGWCNGDTQQLHIGDVTGDGLGDLICHDYKTGLVQRPLPALPGR